MRAASGLIALVACVVLSCNVAAQSGEKIKVSRETRGKSIGLPVEIVLPKNFTGKVPAIIIVHGSGGVRIEREYAYARAFNDLGVAGIVVDSFTPRGIRSTVTDQSPVSAYEMLADAAAVLNAIARHPAIDPARIGLIGFSKGGTVAIKAALKRYMTSLAKDDAHFALVIAVYPWCGDHPLDFTSTGAPLVMMLGANDSYVGIEACREYAQKFAAAGGKVTLTVYPGARHGWDVPGPATWHNGSGENASKCIYDEKQPGQWVERISRLTVVENDKPTADWKRARGRCATLGAAGGYDGETAKRSLQDIRNAVRAAFRLE